MPSLLRISAITTGILILLIAGVWLFFFNTQPGRAIVQSQLETYAEQYVQRLFSSSITFARIEGNLPAEIILRDIELSQNEDVWFKTDTLIVQWSPFALLQQKVIVDKVTVLGAALYTEPPQGSTQKRLQDNQRSIFDTSLPWIEISDLDLDRFTVVEGIFGPERIISLAGSVSTAIETLSSDLQLSTQDDADIAEAVIILEGENLAVNLAVSSTAQGLIAWFLQEEQPVSFSFSGDGLAEDWGGELTVDSLTFGQADLAVRADLSELSTLSVNGAYTSGAIMPRSIQEAIGEQLNLSITLAKADDGYRVIADRLSGFFGEITGQINGLTLSANQDNAEFDIIALLSQDFARGNDLQQLAGQNRAAGLISVQGNSVSGDFTLETPLATAEITNFKKTAEGSLQASVGLTVEQAALEQPLLKELLVEGGKASADINLADGQLRFENLDAYTGVFRDTAQLTLSGNGTIGTADRLLEFNGRLEAKPEMISTLSPQIEFAEVLPVDVVVSGTTDNFSLEIASDFGFVNLLDNMRLAPGNLRAKLQSLPIAPTGNVQLASITNEYDLELSMRSEDQTIVLENIAARAFGIFMTGDVRSNRQNQALSAALDLAAQQGAVLPNGRDIQGNASLLIDIGSDQGEGRPVEVRIEASQLASEQFSADQFQLQAVGPVQDISIDILGENLNLPGGISILALEGAAELSVEEEATELRVMSFEAGDDPGTDIGIIKLLAPATFRTEGPNRSVSPVRLDILGRTEMEFSGTLTNEFIVFSATGDGVLLPALQAPLSFDVRVDTTEQEPGRLRISGEASDQNELSHNLVVESVWNGEALSTVATLTNGDGLQSGALQLQSPMRLVRGDQLSVDYRDGDLQGRFTYDDQLVALLAFLPVDTDFVSADVTADMAIGGTVAAPDVSGGIQLVDGRYEERTTGAQVSDIKGELDFSYSVTGSEGTFRITASDALGTPDTIDLSGSVFLGQQASGDLSVVDGKLILDQATLIQSPELTAEVSSDLDLTGSLSDMLLAGRIDIRKINAVIPTTERRQAYVPVKVVRVDSSGEVITDGRSQGDQRLLDLELDVLIEAKDEIYISGRGMQSEWRGDLKVTGPSSAPVLSGVVQSVDGRVDFAGRQFEISRGRLLFSEEDGLSPDLDIAADYSVQTDQGTVQTTIAISGPAANPSLRITSTPVLPQEDLMALILFGKDPSQLSAFESLRIADAVTQLSGQGLFGGGAGVTGQLAQTFGLDALNFGQDVDTGAGTVSVGKYVSDDIYVSATQGIGTKGSISVTYDINDKVSVETSLEQDGTQSVSANYKRDY